MHRIVAKEERDGILYFYTKGDGNGINRWPEIPSTAEYDPWNNGQGVPENLVVGKVVNTDYPIILFTLGFWTIITISVAAGISVLAIYVSNNLKKRQNRIKQLEERVRQLEEEKKREK